MDRLNLQRVLCFVPLHNAEGKKDVTGAFLPEAKAFCALAEDGVIYQFDNRKGLAARRSEVLKKLSEAQEGLTSVAFFCHGWMDGIQAGFLRKHTPELAAAIKALVLPHLEDEVIVPLYCCSTGKDPQDDPLTASGTGDDSFADKLRDALCSEGLVYCRVMGHTTAAHTTKNPMVLFMDGFGVPDGGVGGYPPVSPKSANWPKWKKALQSTRLRFEMPYMTPAEIHEYL